MQVRDDVKLLVAGLLLVGGCGGSNGRDDGAASGIASVGETAEATEGDSSGADSAGTGGGPGASSGADSQDDGDGPKFDLGIQPDVDAPGGCQEQGGDGPEFSYLWAANSTQGTISKIDTQTVQELGRYIVRPDSAGSPSRTSVNLLGDVAVANRSGGVTKVYAVEERCQDTNGIPGIQTSTDATFLPWGQDECVAWYTPLNYESQRPVAWTHGEFNQGTCEYENIKLWTSGRVGQQTDVLLLDGDDGSVLNMVTLDGFPNDYYGIYGGAVDADGNFWGTKLGGVVLVRVDINDLSWQTWPVPVSSYGMTVDDEGYVWACSSTFGRFDPMTETWATGNGGGYAGCMAASGQNGLLWMGGSGIIGVNRQTLQVEKQWATPGSYGISIDYYGYVWTVAYQGGAHRVDPDTGAVTSYNGLVGAYTYSDMTGYALAHAGGGAPSG
jgi:hypothetical protein